MFWYEGKLPNGEKNLPPKDLFHGQTPPGSGSLLVGEKGIMYSPNDYGAQWILLPEKNFENWQDPAPTLPRNGRDDVGMKEEWVARPSRAGPPAYSNFDFAADMTEAILLGNVAMQAGGRDRVGHQTSRRSPTIKRRQQVDQASVPQGLEDAQLIVPAD
jgi:hypothetical protein